MKFGSTVLAGGALLLAGCATRSGPDRPPMSTYDMGQNSSIITYLSTPKNGRTFSIGADIPILASATNFSRIKEVVFFANGERIARDSKRPYAAVLTKPKPGKYVLYCLAYDNYGSSKCSPGVTIEVK